MTLKTIELASLEATQELVIPEGTIATYDAAQGALAVGSIVNHGTLRILSTSDNQDAVIAARTILNTGSIETELPTLHLQAEKVKGAKKGGTFRAAQLIHIQSDGDLSIFGGIFAAEILKLESVRKVSVSAYRLDAKVKVKAKEVAVGAADGNLEIIEQEIDGDPIYWAGSQDVDGGNLMVPVMNMPGEDVSLYATGHITVSGNIDTRGGDSQHPGRVKIAAGCQKVAWHYDPEDPDKTDETHGMFECVDCSDLSFFHLEVIPPDNETNDKTVTVGDISGKGLNIIAGHIVVGSLNVDNDNIPVNFAGAPSMFATHDVTVGGLITCVNRNDQGVFRGGIVIGAGENITLSDLDAGLLATTTKSGLIKTGNIDAQFASIMILAGQDFGGGGGGIAAGAAIQSFTTLDAKIQTGSLKSQSHVLLKANGTIGTGTITLDPETISGPSSFVVTHDVRVHANINKDGQLPAFLAGGGGTNGTGAITVTNRSYVNFDEKSGVIAISNGPSGDIHLRGQGLKCQPGDKGTPGIVVDAGSGQVRLVGASPLSADGNSDQDAGFVIIQGGELRAPTAAVISASDTKNTAEDEAPTVILAVDKITLPGSLVVNCNGNTGTAVKLAPKGSSGLDIVHIDYTVPIKPQGVSPVVHELQISGSGNLQVHANSDNGQVFCSADPLRFANTGTSFLSSQGAESNVTVTFADAPSGKNTLVFTGGKVTLSVDNKDDDKGTIIVNADKVNNNMAIVELTADGLDSDGGEIQVNIDRGDLTVGTAAGAMSMTATSMGSGNAGNIFIENAKHNGTVTLQAGFTSDALNVNALGSQGKGGLISINADKLVSNNTGDTGLVANGKGDGDGGIISIKVTQDITIGDGLTVTAKSTATGNGGDIDVTSRNGDVTINGSNVSVQAGTDGQGGTINVKAKGHETTLTVAGVLKADGDGNGRGGIINLTAEDKLDLEVGQLSAKGGATARGGRVELRSGADLTIDGGQVIVKPGDQGNNRGGTIDIQSRAKLLATGLFNADGHGDGRGGVITFAADSSSGLTLAGVETSLSASSLGNGRGGDITVINEGGSITLDDLAAVLANCIGANGSGGVITFRAGSSGHLGSISLDDGARIEAESGTAQGSGGQIVLGYFGSDAEQVHVEGNSVVTADQRGLGSGTGSVTAINFQTGPLQVDVDDSVIRALNGSLDFTHPGQDVTVIADSATTIPFIGTIRSSCRSLLFHVIAAPDTTELVFGDLVADEFIALSLTGGGEMNSALETEIKTPELTLEGADVKIGLTRLLNTRVRRIIPNSLLFRYVSVRNTLDEGEDVQIQGDWNTTEGFLFDSTGDVSVGSVRKLTTNIGFILVAAGQGKLTVRADSTISAIEGSVELRAGSLLNPGTILLKNAAAVQAVTGSTTLALGNVNIHCGEPETDDFGDLEIPNVHVTPPGATFVAGVNGLTAEDDCTVSVQQRLARLDGPLVDSITMEGDNVVSVQGEVEDDE